MFFKSALFERLQKVINNVELVAGNEFENSSSEQNSLENIDSSGICDAFMEDLTDLPTSSLTPALVHEDIWATKRARQIILKARQKVTLNTRSRNLTHAG